MNLCNIIKNVTKIWRQILNFPNEVNARSESQCLLYNKENLLLYCRKFSAFIVVVII